MGDDFLSDEDKALFRQAIGTIKPIKKTTVSIHKQRADTPLKIHHEDKPINLSDYYSDEVFAETVLSYCSQNLPGKRLRELKNGQIAWQARLDLHGLRPDAAKASLTHFINHQIVLGHRCLLIIHGKGGYKNEAPVLKNLVNHWLRQFNTILAFHSAIPRDGGAGALYVLLKRHI